MTGALREIGGYLELERFSGQPYHRAEDGAVALNSGRACLEYLIELRGMEAIWLPDWLCSSVPAACAKHGVEVRTYRVGWDMRPAYDFEVTEGEYLYLVDYYGQLDAADVEEAGARSGGRLVVDEAQGFFRPPWPGADTLYTCRKFFGVADGGYLYAGDGARLARELPRDESHGRMGFVLGRFERPAGEFFAQARANNERFADEPVKLMSPITENVMRAIDYEAVRERRDANWRVLDEALRDVNGLRSKAPDGAFMYPLLVEGADGVRQRLAAEGVFVPTLWPNCLSERGGGSVALRYSRDVLPLPVDQRYGWEDMEHMVDVLRRFEA
ncbi:hypothetical protein [Adlercreutzia sp. ZJ242]|uniref:hypothetical protein n=1 Tax=Adlercreutzia sp. ZJ242 TaxID=2709409 RepID=UPI0013ED35C1|nr:hypothetical protein [Adlercreutzia sp. ZJ242]